VFDSTLTKINMLIREHLMLHKIMISTINVQLVDVQLVMESKGDF
jgi:hypothetical protein